MLRGVKGRAVTPELLHLTLAFLGSVDASAQACIEKAVAGLHFEPFDLSLSRFGFWPRPQVIWAGPEVTPPPLQDLHTQISQVIQPCGYRPETRPFSPHVTLMRKAHYAPDTLSLSPFYWRVEGVSLVQSLSSPEGVRYVPLCNWPFR